jgi:hypothetical protein
MELKEFISSTLSDIIEGVADARNNINSNKAVIVPNAGRIYEVEFEVELSDLESKENGKGIGVAFANIGIGVKGSECESGSSRTRIKFSIPIGYPETNR